MSQALCCVLRGLCLLNLYNSPTSTGEYDEHPHLTSETNTGAKHDFYILNGWGGDLNRNFTHVITLN